MNGRIRPQLQLAFIYRLIDVGVIFLALWLSCQSYMQSFSQSWMMVGLFVSLSFPIFAESLDLYRSWRTERYIAQLSVTVSAWLLVWVMLLVLAYLEKDVEIYSRVTAGRWFWSGLLLLCGWRYLFRRILFVARRRGYNSRVAVIVGVTENGIRLAEQMHKNGHLGYNLMGFCDDRDRERLDDNLPAAFLGHVDKAIELARSGDVDRIYIAMPLKAQDRIQEVLLRCSDTTATVSIIPDFFSYDLLQSRWGEIGDMQTLSIYDTPLDGLGAWVKRLEDLVVGGAILCLIVIPMLFIALGIKLTSKGPVLFKQDRYGLDGERIRVWKFRSMTTMDNGDTVRQATKNDVRITPFGSFLRRTSLDELPQFFNVLSGGMSIVGPRPHAVAHNEQYRQLISGYMLRHKVKPGITGWAQINGWRGETETVEKMEGRVHCDLEYIRSWSVLLDFKIIILTVFKGFVSEQAY